MALKKYFFPPNTMLFPRGIWKSNISCMSLCLSPQEEIFCLASSSQKFSPEGWWGGARSQCPHLAHIHFRCGLPPTKSSSFSERICTNHCMVVLWHASPVFLFPGSGFLCLTLLCLAQSAWGPSALANALYVWRSGTWLFRWSWIFSLGQGSLPATHQKHGWWFSASWAL